MCIFLLCFVESFGYVAVVIAHICVSVNCNKEGSFTFGFGDPVDEIIPAGRYRAVANPGMKNRRFGSMEFWIHVEGGRLNESGINNVAILNPQEPFRNIGGGMPQAILAGGELSLDLSEATLEFADGKSTGNVQGQFMAVNEQPYPYINGAAPQWVFHLNPSGVWVTGNIGLKIKMPAMVGSYEYIGYIGERVVLVGLDHRSLQIVPVGVGKVDEVTRMVTSEGQTAFNRLDIIGYALVDPEKQPLLEEFSQGEIHLNELIRRLDGE